jgi:hypothetical protein
VEPPTSVYFNPALEQVWFYALMESLNNVAILPIIPAGAARFAMALNRFRKTLSQTV